MTPPFLTKISGAIHTVRNAETARLKGKRVLLTGAAGGIGVAAADRLRRAGADVVGLDLVASDGVIAADVTDRESVLAAVEEVMARLGGLDVVINNAGLGWAGDAGDHPDEAARRTLEVNLFGTWNVTAACMTHLLESRGHVVNVSSGLSLVDLPFAAAYSASKRAVDAYSAALRLEYGHRISVTTLHPGYIRTAIHAGPAAAGATLEGLVRADTVEQAGVAIERACITRPRTSSTSVLSTLELWAARRSPRITGWILARRFERWKRSHRSPSFLRFPAS